MKCHYFIYYSMCLDTTHSFTTTSPGGQLINSLRPRENGCHFPDDAFKRIFLYENVRISIKISMKFVPKGPINNCPSLVQMMAWRQPGNKPLSEPMMVRLLTHICVTRSQWVKESNMLYRHSPSRTWKELPDHFIRMVPITYFTNSLWNYVTFHC